MEYHGLRIPYLGIVPEMEKKLMIENPSLLNLMLNGLEEEFQPGL